MNAPKAPVLTTLGLAAALAMAGPGDAAPEKAWLGRSAVAPPSEAQIAAGSDRLRASAARLNAAAHEAELRPASASARNELKTAVSLTEAGYEYLIAMFSRLQSGDDKAHLDQLRRSLDELKKQKQALLAKMAASTKANEWRSSLPGLVALSDRAVAAASVARPRFLTPTPVR